MSHFSYPELLTASQGDAFTPPVAFGEARLWTDTRSIQPGDFFLPLSGERFDGHHYLEQAFEAGAVGAFVERHQAAQNPQWQKLPNLIAVDSPVLAYLAMARYHREKINPVVIAVTGSSGKTTTKEMLYAALSPLKQTVKTEKNFNNEVGVSQTLLALRPGTEILIVEMGMRGLRQICLLSEAARPDVAIINNIGPAHIGLLGSLEAIAQAKLEVVEGMNPAQGLLVINQDTPHLSGLAPTLWSGKTVSYSLNEAQNLQPALEAGVEGSRFTYGGVTVTLPVPGEHMVSNALGVLKVGEALGFSAAALASGLSQFKPEKGRGERVMLQGYRDVCVIDDAYNANPDSAKASLKAFLSTVKPGKQNFLVIGGMKELGDFSQQYHQQLGFWLAAQPHINGLFTLGEEGQWLADAASSATFPVRHAQDIPHLVRQLTEGSFTLENAVLYLKGSRAYQLDQIPAALERVALNLEVPS
ncbi:UDP-N-acetylmuramoyl-tripeptide--D-alanyl-D-alanine ligase [Vampirovibrio sp.]|uniref:UDP-N-acetylmuramoyl-tripeptide--D-alanyl-D- alanine ligase n=1 Tax=Vampirovibrio sp. TaxID=2717857 RepID=UPI0035931C47